MMWLSRCVRTPKLSCPFCSTPLSVGRPDIIRSNVPGAKWVEHGFDDPSDVEGSEEEKVRAFRSTRDEIRNWVLRYFSN